MTEATNPLFSRNQAPAFEVAGLGAGRHPESVI